MHENRNIETEEHKKEDHGLRAWRRCRMSPEKHREEYQKESEPCYPEREEYIKEDVVCPIGCAILEITDIFFFDENREHGPESLRTISEEYPFRTRKDRMYSRFPDHHAMLHAAVFFGGGDGEKHADGYKEENHGKGYVSFLPSALKKYPDGDIAAYDGHAEKASGNDDSE